MRVGIVVLSRSLSSGVSVAQMRFAAALRINGVDARCLTPTRHWERVVERLPKHLQEFLICVTLPGQARKLQMDIVLAPSWYGLLFGRRAVPVFHGCYGLALASRTYRTSLGKLKMRFLWALERLAATVASRSICVSDVVMQAFGDSKNTSVVWNGLDTTVRDSATRDPSARKALGIPLDSQVVLLAGRYSPEKRFEIVLSFKRRAGRHYVIAVPTDVDADRLQQLIPSERSDIQVLHAPDGISDFLWAACDVFFLSSIFEACPLVWIEAAARGIPVASTRVGHLPELARREPWLAEFVRDHTEIEEAIDSALVSRDKLSPLFQALAANYHDLRVVGQQLNGALVRR
jgi:glycosyltransferase involved in cell wall biosynthesis